MILAGIFLGLGLHGYSPFRIVPFLVVAVFGIYFLHAGSKLNRQQAFFWLSAGHYFFTLRLFTAHALLAWSAQTCSGIAPLAV
jgi:hypothetical protein